LLGKWCVDEQISGHFRAEPGVITAMPALSFLSYIVECDCCPDCRKVAPLMLLYCFSQRDNSLDMIEIMRGIAGLFVL
jgi:hypothetical protein